MNRIELRTKTTSQLVEIIRINDSIISKQQELIKFERRWHYGFAIMGFLVGLALRISLMIN